MSEKKMGKPFFVTKERFPHTPSRKVILEGAYFILIRLNPSKTIFTF